MSLKCAKQSDVYMQEAEGGGLAMQESWYVGVSGVMDGGGWGRRGLPARPLRSRAESGAAGAYFYTLLMLFSC